MGKYNNESNEFIRAKIIGENQFNEMCMNGKDESGIYFLYNDITICNPFMDDTGRFELTLKQAYEKYGTENVDKFIDECVKKGD